MSRSDENIQFIISNLEKSEQNIELALILLNNKSDASSILRNTLVILKSIIRTSSGEINYSIVKDMRLDFRAVFKSMYRAKTTEDIRKVLNATRHNIKQLKTYDSKLKFLDGICSDSE